MSWSIGKRSFRPTTIYVRGNTALHFCRSRGQKTQNSRYSTDWTTLYKLNYYDTISHFPLDTHLYVTLSVHCRTWPVHRLLT